MPKIYKYNNQDLKPHHFYKLNDGTWIRHNSDGTNSTVSDGSHGTFDVMKAPSKVQDDYVSKYNRSVYNTVDPTGGPPGILEALGIGISSLWNSTSHKRRSTNHYRGNSAPANLADSVSDAAWRKRLKIPYNQDLLPTFNGDTVRLPPRLEAAIPTDTTMLKNRIQANQKYLDKHPYGEESRYVKLGIDSDQKALNALRKTYQTGKPVGIDEFSFNGRSWINNGSLTLDIIPPLNVLGNYNIRYDKQNNRMYYSDTYDFNGYDWAVPGNSFPIRGYIDLDK